MVASKHGEVRGKPSRALSLSLGCVSSHSRVLQSKQGKKKIYLLLVNHPVAQYHSALNLLLKKRKENVAP